MKIDLHPQAKQEDRAYYDKLQLLRLNNLAVENGLIAQYIKQKIERTIWAR